MVIFSGLSGSGEVYPASVAQGLKVGEVDWCNDDNDAALLQKSKLSSAKSTAGSYKHLALLSIFICRRQSFSP